MLDNNSTSNALEKQTSLPDNWRQCPPPFQKYAVDDTGTVWNIKRRTIKKPKPKCYHFKAPEVAFDKPIRVPDPRLVIQVSISGKGSGRSNLKTLPLARLVCLTWNGEPSRSGWEASHLDGDVTNNLPSNLYWEAPERNRRRYYETNDVRGTNNPNRSLSEREVRGIWDMRWRLNQDYDTIGKFYSTSVSTVCRVCNRLSYQNVELPDKEALREQWLEAHRSRRNIF